VLYHVCAYYYYGFTAVGHAAVLSCLPSSGRVLHAAGLLSAGRLIARLLLDFIFDRLRLIQLSPADSCCHPYRRLYVVFA
jgi:hypothetical protein